MVFSLSSLRMSFPVIFARYLTLSPNCSRIHQQNLVVWEQSLEQDVLTMTLFTLQNSQGLSLLSSRLMRQSTFTEMFHRKGE